MAAALPPARALAATDAAVLEALEETLQAALAFAPGAILSVEGPDIAFLRAAGLADKNAGLAMSPRHTLRCGSITKTCVAALVLMAAQEGLLALDASIEASLPDAVLAQLPDGLRPSVRQLLNHTSGVPDYYDQRFYLEDWRDRGPLTTPLVLHAIRGKSATAEPGAEFSYSNTNYHVLALALERVHGQPLSVLLEKRIFQPAALRETYYGLRHPPGDVIHGYGSPLDEWVDTYDWQENSGPDGGLFATAQDLSIWLRALFSPQGQFADLGTLMTTDPVMERERKWQGLGTEILVSRSGARVLGHTGGLDGYLTAAFYVPDRDTTIVLHLNKSDADGFSAILGQVLRIVLEA